MNIEGVGYLCFFAGALALALGQAAWRWWTDYNNIRESKYWLDLQYRIRNAVSTHESRYHSDPKPRTGKCASRPKK